MSEFKITAPAGNDRDDVGLFVRPIDLNITFSEYFRLKFEAVSRGMLMSQYVREMLQDEEYIMALDEETLSLFRKLSSFVNDIDYYIIWGGDGFWRIKRSPKTSGK